jgi:hypothetical protein
MKHFLLLISFLFINQTVLSQYKSLSPDSRISVLTIGPGSSLNDSFGHSGYRVKDSLMDIVFNYGVYDFNTPNFYTKFAQGKLNYKIGANYYEDFKESYIRQNRTIQEQILNLSLDEKQKVFDYLSKNYEPANQYYLYDFFYDNCATKIKDVLVYSLNDNIKFNKPESFENKTFRTLIQENLNWNSWGSFGIDLALGSVIDRKASATEHMFLPDYIYRFFDAASLKSNSDKKLVIEKNTIYKRTDTTASNNFLTSPLLIMLLISLGIIYITYIDLKNKRRSKWLDIILFLFTGSIGIIILLLWFATDHEATAGNYNLLWAFAINIFMVIQVTKNKPGSWFRKYIKFLVIVMCLLALHWIIGIQRFAFVIIPLLIALLIRYLYLIKYYKNQMIL